MEKERIEEDMVEKEDEIIENKTYRSVRIDEGSKEGEREE